MSDPRRSLVSRLGAGETVAILAVVAAFAIPFVTRSAAVYSLTNQILVAATAALSVFIMLRVNLMTFAVPTFMAVGGYTAAICGLRFGMTEVVPIAVLSFVVPALVALPLGALVLRLRGVYFVLVTFVLTEITQLLLFETPALTGGSNGLIGMPGLTFLGRAIVDNRAVVFTTIALALAATIVTVILTRGFRRQFAGIEENELLSASLGLVVWHYKAFGFAAAAGVAGLAGFALVNMLLTAHPSSFSPMSSVQYIAYAFIGGRTTILGPIVGAGILVWAADVFAIRGEYSQMLFGFLIVFVVLVARDGLAGAGIRGIREIRRRLERGSTAETVSSAAGGSR